MSFLLGLFIIVVFLTIYFLPSIIGYKKKNFSVIFVMNLFLGWTLLGWVVSLCFALWKGE